MSNKYIDGRNEAFVILSTSEDMQCNQHLILLEIILKKSNMDFKQKFNNFYFLHSKNYKENVSNTISLNCFMLLKNE